MTLGTLLFVILFFLGMFVSVFYLEYAVVGIMGLLVVVPVAMILILIRIRTRVSVSVDAKNPVAEKDDMEKPARPAMTLSISNDNKILPITKGIAKVRYENVFTGEKGHMKVRFSVDAGRKRDRRIPIVMQNCGNVAITVEKVRVYDYLSIFAWTIGKNLETQNILVLPPLKEMYLGEDRWYNETNEDSDRFSLYKKGDDPSEVFDIREYMDGDKIQRIHWKLTSKTGKTMVKEGSLPLTQAVNIFIDTSTQGTEEARCKDANHLVQGVYSISMFMIEHRIPQNYIWYDEQNEMIQERLVEQEEELLWMFQDLFKTPMSEQPDALVEAYLAWEEGKMLESAIYLTVTDHGALENTGLVKERLEVMDLRGEELENEK